jgi:hypothetical protein
MVHLLLSSGKAQSELPLNSKGRDVNRGSNTGALEGSAMPFACSACGCPSVVLPEKLVDDALVHCQRCNSVLATWAVFKTRTTQIILAETQGEITDLGLLGPDPLDVDLLRGFGTRA